MDKSVKRQGHRVVDISGWWGQTFDASGSAMTWNLLSRDASERNFVIYSKLTQCAELYAQGSLKVHTFLDEEAQTLLTRLVQKEFLSLDIQKTQRAVGAGGAGSFEGFFANTNTKTLSFRCGLWLGLANAYKEACKPVENKEKSIFTQTQFCYVSRYLKLSLEEIVGSPGGGQALRELEKNDPSMKEHLFGIKVYDTDQFIYASLCKPIKRPALEAFIASFPMETEKERERYIDIVSAEKFHGLIHKSASEDKSWIKKDERNNFELIKIVLAPLVAARVPVWDLTWGTELKSKEAPYILASPGAEEEYVSISLTRAAKKLDHPSLVLYLEEVQSVVEYHTLENLVQKGTEEKSLSASVNKARI